MSSAWRYQRHGRAEAGIHLVTTDLVARRFNGETTVSRREPTSADQMRISG
ncbi:hypothetical protein [Streptomyces sp. NPDC001537]